MLRTKGLKGFSLPSSVAKRMVGSESPVGADMMVDARNSLQVGVQSELGVCEATLH